MHTACGSEDESNGSGSGGSTSTGGMGGTSTGGMGGEVHGGEGGDSNTTACQGDRWDDDDDPDTACELRTTCAAGEYVTDDGSGTEDRSCASCAAGTFSDTENADACADWSTCDDEFVEDAAGTATSDRVCRPLAWTSQLGSSAADYGKGVSVDADGNVYVAGHTAGALPGQTSAGGADAFLIKYDRVGNVLWTRQFGSSEYDSGMAVGVDGSGNVYVAGYTDGTLPGETSAGLKDVFVRKYDAAGEELWTEQFGSNGEEYAYGLTVDDDGNVFVAGQTAGALTNQPSAGANDAFVRKLDATGSEVWTHQFGTTQNDHGLDMGLDLSGNVYLAGVTLGGLPGYTNAGGRDVFVRKLDATGDAVWTHQVGSSLADFAYAVNTDGAGNVYVAGYADGALPGQTSAGGSDLYVHKLDDDGDVVWTRQFGTSADDLGWGGTVDANGNAYVVGAIGGTLPDQTSAGAEDAVVRAYDPDGNELWTRQFGSIGNDHANAVTVTDDGYVYVTGAAGGALPDQTHALGSDVFLLKWKP